MAGIVVVCAAFGLTASEAKTKIMCLRTTGIPESTAIFSVEAARPDVLPNERVRIPRGERQPQCRPVHREVDRRIRSAWCSFRKYTLELYDRASAPLELKIRTPRAEVLETMLYDSVTWSPRVCHNDTLRRVHHSFMTRYIGWRNNNRTDHPISYLDTLMETGNESIEAIMRRRDDSSSRDLWRLHAWRTRDCRSA